MRMVLLVSVWMAGCSVAESGPSVTVDPADLAAIGLRPGVSDRSVPLGGGPRLDFILDVPDLEDAGAVPLVLALPYAGAPAASAREYYDVLAGPGLRELGAVVVVPVAFDGNWNTPAAVSAIASFVEAAVEAWPVDPGRVVVTGYSNGGNGAWAQAEQHGDLYSAAIPMGSYAPTDPPTRVPLYVVHGRDDELFPAARAERAAEQVARAGGQVTVEVLPYSHFQAGRYAAALARAATWLERDVWAR